MQSFDIDGDKAANLDIAHNVLHYMARVRQVYLWEYGFSHVEGAADCRDCHLFAGSSCDNKLALGEQQGGCFGFINSYCDGHETLFIVCAVGNAPQYHI